MVPCRGPRWESPTSGVDGSVAWLRAPDLDAVARASDAGSIAIGASLAELPIEQLGALAARGLSHAHVVIAGPDARAHDFVRRAPGEHDAIYARIGQARAHGIEILATTPLHRSLQRVLAATAQSIAARGIAAWCIEVLDPHDIAVDAPWPEVPRLAIGLPFALHAIERARALGVVAFVRGAPSCLLGRLGERAIGSSPRAFGAPCGACPARPACPGVSAAYLARFGDRELSPRVGVVASSARIAREALLGALMERASEGPAAREPFAGRR